MSHFYGNELPDKSYFCKQCDLEKTKARQIADLGEEVDTVKAYIDSILVVERSSESLAIIPSSVLCDALALAASIGADRAAALAATTICATMEVRENDDEVESDVERGRLWGRCLKILVVELKNIHPQKHLHAFLDETLSSYIASS